MLIAAVLWTNYFQEWILPWYRYQWRHRESGNIKGNFSFTDAKARHCIVFLKKILIHKKRRTSTRKASRIQIFTKAFPRIELLLFASSFSLAAASLLSFAACANVEGLQTNSWKESEIGGKREEKSYTKIAKSQETKCIRIAYVDSALASLRSCVISIRSLSWSSEIDPLWNIINRSGQHYRNRPTENRRNCSSSNSSDDHRRHHSFDTGSSISPKSNLLLA